MEFCNLGSVRDYLARRPGRRLPEPEARSFLRQLAAGLLFLWSRSLVHRDLKTDNLLLSTNPNPSGPPILKFWVAHLDIDVLPCRHKIADFGIADYDENEDKPSATPMREPIGTLMYMAPEIFTEKQYDAR
ncbi:kinase-like domain-containing protein, partial [Blyttiomyces helicus]